MTQEFEDLTDKFIRETREMAEALDRLLHGCSDGEETSKVLNRGIESIDQELKKIYGGAW